MKQLKAIHDLFLFEDDLFRNGAEIFRNVPCTGMGQNRTSIFKSRQIYRTTALYSDLSSISVKYGASIFNMKLQPNDP